MVVEPRSAVDATPDARERALFEDMQRYEQMRMHPEALRAALEVARTHPSPAVLLFVAREQLVVGLYSAAFANAEAARRLAPTLAPALAPARRLAELSAGAAEVSARASSQLATVAFVTTDDAARFGLDGRVVARGEQTRVDPGRHHATVFEAIEEDRGRCVEHEFDVPAGARLELRWIAREFRTWTEHP